MGAMGMKRLGSAKIGTLASSLLRHSTEITLHNIELSPQRAWSPGTDASQVLAEIEFRIDDPGRQGQGKRKHARGESMHDHAGSASFERASRLIPRLLIPYFARASSCRIDGRVAA